MIAGIRKLVNSKCELLITPINLAESSDTVYVEFMSGEGVNSYMTIAISSLPDLYRFPLDRDGLYMYFRLEVFKKSYIDSEFASYENRIYYDDVNNKLMFNNKVIDNNVIDDFVEFYYNNREDVVTHYGIKDCFDEPVFSICKLSKCLEDKQRHFIFNIMKNCGGSCDDNTYDRFERDFLFSTVFILRQLIVKQQYKDALQILNKVYSCNGICKDFDSNNNCGCA